MCLQRIHFFYCISLYKYFLLFQYRTTNLFNPLKIRCKRLYIMRRLSVRNTSSVRSKHYERTDEVLRI